MDRSTMMEYIYQPQPSFIGYLSQLGGALNLWAGITFVVVIEIVEVIFELVGMKVAQWRVEKKQDYNANCESSFKSNKGQNGKHGDWL